MKTLALEDGDLVVSKRDYAPVSGIGKIRQDLRGALLEPMGNDRFHTGWGSLLEQAIAAVVDENLRLDIESEVNRVVTNYAAVQNDQIDTDVTSQTDSRFTTDEILSRIESIKVTTSLDSVLIAITLQTASGQVVALTTSVAA
jgi:phage baseplate assembly protein W